MSCFTPPLILFYIYPTYLSLWNVCALFYATLALITACTGFLFHITSNCDGTDIDDTGRGKRMRLKEHCRGATMVNYANRLKTELVGLFWTAGCAWTREARWGPRRLFQPWAILSWPVCVWQNSRPTLRNPLGQNFYKLKFTFFKSSHIPRPVGLQKDIPIRQDSLKTIKPRLPVADSILCSRKRYLVHVII